MRVKKIPDFKWQQVSSLYFLVKYVSDNALRPKSGFMFFAIMTNWLYINMATRQINKYVAIKYWFELKFFV